MEDSDRLEGLKFISQTHRDLHSRRQKYEWRTLFATLSFFVLTVAAVYSRRLIIPEAIGIKILIWAIFSLWTIVAVVFLRHVHKANARNKSFAETAEGGIMRILNGDPYSRLEFPVDTFRKTYWAFWSQAILIVIISVTAAALLTCFKPASQIQKKQSGTTSGPNQSFAEMRQTVPLNFAIGQNSNGAYELL